MLYIHGTREIFALKVYPWVNKKDIFLFFFHGGRHLPAVCHATMLYCRRRRRCPCSRGTGLSIHRGGGGHWTLSGGVEGPFFSIHAHGVGGRRKYHHMNTSRGFFVMKKSAFKKKNKQTNKEMF